VDGRVKVSPTQEIGAERLWRLDRDDRGTVECGRDPAVVHLLHSVHAGYPRDRCSFSPGGVEHGAEDLEWRERPRGVVDGDPRVAVASVDGCGNAVLAAITSLEKDDVGQLKVGGDPANRVPPRRRGSDGDEVEAAGGGDGLEGDREDGPSRDNRPELVLPRSRSAAEGRNDERAGQRCATLARTGRSTRGLVESSAVSVAKIILPAVVWSTVVTVTVTVSSTRLLPFSTTTMVPSSK